MAGGVGTRLWPMSTSKKPKQYHDVLNVGRTLIQQTYDRLCKIVSKENIYVITNVEFIKITQKQLPELKPYQIIGEPAIMNTVACNLYLAKKLHSLNPHACLIIAPSDHIILNEQKFVENVQLALKISENHDYLITLGIEPTRPDTGYGYIQFVKNDDETIKKVKTFTEKPNLEWAQKFVESKEFLWNAGIFIWTSSTILNTFEKLEPDMFKAFSKMDSYYNTEQEEEFIRKIYPMVSNISIDYAIMENASNVYVIPSNFGWSDLGTWKSLYENSEKKIDNNVFQGKFVQLNHSKNCIVRCEEKKAIVIDGLENYIVVDTPKALLICPINKEQNVKHYVNDLKTNKGGKFI